MLLEFALALGLQAAPVAAALPELAPGTRYDPGIPTLRQVVGHDVGEEITTPEQIVAFLRALNRAAPSRTALVEYARSWEGRPLHVLVVGSSERISRLDAIKAGLRTLADPRRVSPPEGERLAAELPVVVWLMHAVHGNEISSADAALAEAYHLLAAEGSPEVDAILRDAIVIIDPLQNPDGRARFLFQNQLGRAASPDAEPASAEHDEPWPGGRSNHYLFDLNRDWFAQSQPETQGRTRVYLEWQPHVVVDLHEMSGNSTYYFAPPADPLNPLITKPQIAWFDVFGRHNAARFDERGFAYFTREVYDSFYPGYGESWPIFQGAIGMTYEQASARGLVFRRSDDSLLSFRDGILHHFTAAIATARTAAQNRGKLLRDFLEYRRSAVQEGERGPTKEYLLVPGVDPSRAGRLARLLVSQGVEVRRADAVFTAGGRPFPPGTYAVSLAQPSARLLRNLLEPHIAQPDAFIKEQDRRRKLRLGDQIYDVTAWSLAHAYDVEMVAAGAIAVRTSPVTADGQPRPLALAAATVGYLMPWGSGTAALVVEALAQGITVSTADKAFTLGGRDYPAGTAFVRLAGNLPDAAERLGRLAGAHGVEVVPIDSAFVEKGISLGSGQVATLKAPHVLMAWDAPADSLSAGWARFVIERRWGQAVTAVRVSSFPRVDLRRYDVVVLPSGNYATALSAEMVRRLKDWVSGGGTLVTLGEATRWATREGVGLLETRAELRDGRPEGEAAADEDPKESEAPPKPFDYGQAISPEREPPEATPGAMLRVTLDPEHWLAAGTDREIQVLVESRRVFMPIRLDKGRNVGVYQPRDTLVAGGLAWPEAQEQLARKPWLIHQPLAQGHVVAFAEDPNYRAFTEATQLLFINAILLGPAH